MRRSRFFLYAPPNFLGVMIMMGLAIFAMPILGIISLIVGIVRKVPNFIIFGIGLLLFFTFLFVVCVL